MSDSKKDSSGWKNCKDCSCPKCKSKNVQGRENRDGDFPHRCLDCKHLWVIDGADY